MGIKEGFCKNPILVIPAQAGIQILRKNKELSGGKITFVKDSKCFSVLHFKSCSRSFSVMNQAKQNPFLNNK